MTADKKNSNTPAKSGKRLPNMRRWYDQVFDNMSDAMVMVEVADGIRFRSIEVNPAFEKATGIRRADLLGKDIEESMPRETGRRALAPYRRCLDSGTVTTDELVLDLPAGRRSLRSTLIPVCDDSGKIRGIISLARDMALSESTRNIALMHFALDHVREAIFLINPEGGFEYVNHEACRILGYSFNQFLNLKVSDIDPDFPMERWSGHWHDLQSKGSMTFEARHRTKAGLEFPVEINANYFEFEGQGYTLALVRDISDSLRNKKTLCRQQKDLAAQKAALTVLLDHTRQSEAEIRENVQASLENMVIPYLDEAMAAVSDNAVAFVALQAARGCLKHAITPYARKMISPAVGLSPRELQITDLIRQGLATKEIACRLNLAVGTVEFYRDRIRKKLKIKNKKTNLRTHLLVSSQE